MLGYVLCSFLDANGLLSSALTIFSTSSAGSSYYSISDLPCSHGKGTYLGWVQREGHSKGIDILDIEHGWVDDADSREELRVGAGEHGDFPSPCYVTTEYRA